MVCLLHQTTTTYGSIYSQTLLAAIPMQPLTRPTLACPRYPGLPSQAASLGAYPLTFVPPYATDATCRTLVPVYGIPQAVLLSYIMYLVAAVESLVVHRIVTVSGALSNKRQCVTKYGGLLNTARCGGGAIRHAAWSCRLLDQWGFNSRAVVQARTGNPAAQGESVEAIGEHVLCCPARA